MLSILISFVTVVHALPWSILADNEVETAALRYSTSKSHIVVPGHLKCYEFISFFRPPSNFFLFSVMNATDSTVFFTFVKRVTVFGGCLFRSSLENSMLDGTPFLAS